MKILRPFIFMIIAALIFPPTFVSAKVIKTVTISELGIKLTEGIEHVPTKEGFNTFVHRDQLPTAARNFRNISVQSWDVEPDIEDGADIHNIAYYSDSGFRSAVPYASSFYTFVILFDGDANPLAYYIGSIETAGSMPPLNTSIKPKESNPNQYGSDVDPNYNKQGPALFSDVDSNHWAYAAIKDLSTRQVLGGYPDGKFRPERVVTRAEFAKIMVLVAGLTPTEVTYTSFSDIKPNDWYTPYIEAAKDYLSGYTLPNSQFIYDPEAPALREDIAVAVVKLKGYDKTRLADRSIIQAMFTDYSSISDYAKDYVALAVENKLASGFPDETFRAQNPITRAEAAAMLWRAYQQGNDNKVQQGTPKAPSGIEKGSATQQPAIVPPIQTPSVTDSVYVNP